MAAPHIMVVDPAVKRPAFRSFNNLVALANFPMSYHLPAMFGTDSLEQDRDGVVGILILGSAMSVNDEAPWQDALRKWIQPKIEAKIPTLGICYGHQMLAHLFGGKVDFLTPAKDKLIGFREVRLDSDPLWNHQPLTGRLRVSHCEHVTVCPNVMKIIGKSDAVAIEALAHKSLPVWSFQPHPEAVPGSLDAGAEPTKPDPMAYEFGYELMKFFVEYVKKQVK